MCDPTFTAGLTGINRARCLRLDPAPDALDLPPLESVAAGDALVLHFQRDIAFDLLENFGSLVMAVIGARVPAADGHDDAVAIDDALVAAGGCSRCQRSPIQRRSLKGAINALGCALEIVTATMAPRWRRKDGAPDSLLHHGQASTHTCDAAG